MMVYHIWSHSLFVLWDFYLNHMTVVNVGVKIPKEEQGWQNGGERDGMLGDYLCRDGSGGIVTRLRAGRPDQPWGRTA